MAKLNLTISIGVLFLATAWAFASARVCWLAGDYMIGFSVFIMFGLPLAALCFFVGAFIALSRKSKLIGISSLIACVLIATPTFFMHQISKTAWNYSIQRHSLTNQNAILHTDFADSIFSDSDFPDERKMVNVNGFEWHCEQHVAAPNGVFNGFVYNSIPHIYVNKLRHRMRGVAWVPDSTLIPNQSDYHYTKSRIENWYIWTYGG